MHSLMRILPTITVLLLMGGVSHAGKFRTIKVNKGNQKERAKGYFSITVAERTRGHFSFTVHVKANPEDKQVLTSLATLEIFEGSKRVGLIPIDRLTKRDGSGHIISFILTRPLAAKSTLSLVQLTGPINGIVFRVDLGSYAGKRDTPKKRAR